MKAEDRYDSLLQFYAEANSVPWVLVKRQMLAESGADPNAVSPAGAVGLMQFMPATWRVWGSGDPTNPEESIRAGCAYLAYLFSRFPEIRDSVERYKFALAAYNAGLGNVNQCLRLARRAAGAPESHKEWVRLGKPLGPWQTWSFARRLLPEVTGENAMETIEYVNKILPGSELTETA